MTETTTMTMTIMMMIMKMMTTITHHKFYATHEKFYSFKLLVLNKHGIIKLNKYFMMMMMGRILNSQNFVHL